MDCFLCEKEVYDTSYAQKQKKKLKSKSARELALSRCGPLGEPIAVSESSDSDSDSDSRASTAKLTSASPV